MNASTFSSKEQRVKLSHLMKEEEFEQGLEGWDGLGSAEGKWESPVLLSLFYFLGPKCHFRCTRTLL